MTQQETSQSPTPLSSGVFLYDGVNEAKVCIDSVTKYTNTTARLSTQFTTAQGNTTIKQLGLYDNSDSGNLWAIANVNINKVAGERLTIYWYLTFA